MRFQPQRALTSPAVKFVQVGASKLAPIVPSIPHWHETPPEAIAVHVMS